MITKNIFEKFYPLVNEIVSFSYSLTIEDDSNWQLYNHLNSKGILPYFHELKKIIHSYIRFDILNCYSALGYGLDYNSNNFVLFDIVQYAFWFEKDHFSYDDFVNYVSSDINSNYFRKEFNNVKKNIDSIEFPILYFSLSEVDKLKGEDYLLILKKIVSTLSDDQYKNNNKDNNAIFQLFNNPQSSLKKIVEDDEVEQIKGGMVTNEEYENIYLLANKIVRFEKLLINKSKLKQDFSEFLESIGYLFHDDFTYENAIRAIISDDILNCYFLLGYPQFYNSNSFLLLDLIEYAFYFGEIPWSYKEFQAQIESQYSTFFSKVFEATKEGSKSVQFPSLYIELSNVDDIRAEEYINLLQSIVITHSKNQYRKDELIDVLLSNPKMLLSSNNDHNESQQLENEEDGTIIDATDNYNKEHYNMELLKDKLFNGISFEIIREEYREGYSSPFRLLFHVTNFNDHKKKIEVEMKYISIKYGLKSGCCIGVYNGFVPDNTFVDLEIVFADITSAYNGDRIELLVNDGKFASLRLIRERNQWMIVESVERSTSNRELKGKIEHLEAIEEQFGITLQNFSVKVEDENSMKLFCELLALNGELPKENFTINLAIYDNNNDIVYTDDESKYAEDFKGFEVLTFDYIKLDITVDEISKIRLYPTR